MGELKPKAIYKVVPACFADRQVTLIYNSGDGFSWVKIPGGNSEWSCYAPTAIGAELEALKAGLVPEAVAYL